MGLQSLAYYVTLTWLPEILQEEGMGVARGGVDARALSGRGDRDNVLGTNDRREECLSAGCGCGGRARLASAFGPSCCRFTASTLWVVLLGLGQGASFSLALTFFALRSPDPGHAAALSGMAQSVGYLLAAGGPSASCAM